MDTMNDLLICAKAVGHSARIDRGRVYLGYQFNEYNPLTNDAQCWELETFAQQNGWVFSFSHTLDEYCARHPKAILFTSKKRNEVVVKAVVAMEDTHECNT